MKSFDDLLEQSLYELSLDGIGRAVDSKVGVHAANKFLAGLGSKSAKGRANYQQMVNNIHGAWRQYQAEQKIHIAHVDDLMEFLKHNQGLNFTDEWAMQWSYGNAASQKSQHEGEVQTAIAALQSAVEGGKQIDSSIYDTLKKLAASDPGTEVLVRKNLFTLYRNNASSVNAFRPVKDLIGGRTVDKPMLDKIFPQIARMKLKKTGKGSSEDGSSDGKGPPARPTADYHTGNRKNDAMRFISDLSQLGITETLQKQAFEMVMGNKEADFAADLAKKIREDFAYRAVNIYFQLYNGTKFKKISENVAKIDPDLSFYIKQQKLMMGSYKYQDVDTNLRRQLTAIKGRETVYHMLTIIMAATAKAIGK